MSEAFITVARIQPPAPGKKQGAIYDTSDKRWGVWPDDLHAFQVGAQYKIWDWKSNMFQGKQYDSIQKDCYQQLNAGGGLAAGNQAKGAQTQRPAAPDFSDVTRRRDIFVCGALNNLLSNESIAGLFFKENKLDGHYLVDAVWKLRKVFDYSLGPAAQDPAYSTAKVGPGATPEQQADASLGYGRVADDNRMNDEIPF